MDKYYSYFCECCKEAPKPGIIKSMPSLGGEYVNMYGLPSYRKYLIETAEGNLTGICSKTNKLVNFIEMDDTYVVQIPSIIKLKEELDKIPNQDFDEQLLTPKHRFRK